MFHSRSFNNKINYIHARSLKIKYNDKSFSYQNVLDKEYFLAILHRNIRVLAIETYKNLQDLSLLILNEVFKERDCNYNLQINNFLNS